MTEQQLAERRQRKAKKPRFLRQDARKKAEVSQTWRKPRGLHSKMRLNKRGYPRCVSPGWGSPRAVEGLTREGLVPVRVATLAELAAIDPKRDAAVLMGTLGAKKREQLLKEAKARKILVVNVKDVDAALVRIGAARTRLAERRAARASRRENKKAAAKKTIEERVTKEELQPSEAEKAEALAEEKRRVLTKKA